MNKAKRIFGLDLLRAVAIVFVLLDHGGYNPIPQVLLGGLGVELFFVLSGYLIGGILLRDFENFNGVKTLKNFWIRRWFRTLPLYYFALGFQVFIAGNWKWEYLYYLLFLQNNFYGISLFPVSWSLVIEEWFYLSLPLIFVLLFISRKKIVLQDLIGYGLFLILIKFIYIAFKELPFSGVNGNILLRADTMLIGVLVAFIKRYRKSIFYSLSKSFVIIISLIGILFHQWYFMIHTGCTALDQSTILKLLYFPTLSILVGLQIPYLATSKFLNKKIASWPIFSNVIIWTSILSYSFYLFHQNVFHFSRSTIFLKDYFALQLLLLTVISLLLYHLFEKPVTDLRDKFKWS